MPGPSNSKSKKRKAKGKSKAPTTATTTTATTTTTTNQTTKADDADTSLESTNTTPSSCYYHSFSPSPPSSPSPTLLTPPPPFQLLPANPLFPFSHYTDTDYPLPPHPSKPILDPHLHPYIESVLLTQPYIHDPGNGPRVRDPRAFLEGKFFVQDVALDDPMCAEFAQEEVLEMLKTVLPEETALILWYNKSRSTSRICPACQRLYHLGDILPEHMSHQDDYEKEEPDDKRRRQSPQLDREQDLSGLCSPVCFILASFNYPGAIKSAWGRTADEMDDTTWELLNAPHLQPNKGMDLQSKGNKMKDGADESRALGMLVKMTRLHDLGLAQLCFGEEELEAQEEFLDES
ncbi:hypothetical protein BDQ12DRAFT_652665 [Crucibulum laeve]|uniref:Uncharacterized protein n=1 Tax=Crucibulum laeve TaxID=68775 RepID=A0A5C3M0E1_9AGAR|nr:hypothetical protein BDQ12DRAFT_652665 [Crucibulum laeve]